MDPALESALRTTLGGLFIGVIIAGVLWGISTCQAFHYYTTRPKDVMWIKVLVGLVWSLDTALQMLLFVFIFDCCVTNFGNYSHLVFVPSTVTPVLGILGFQSMLVQSFYIHKILILSRWNKLVMFPMGALMISEFACAIWLIQSSTSMTKTTVAWDVFLEHERLSRVVVAGLGFVIDCMITIMISALLRGSKTEYVETNSMIGRLIMFFASTNMLTALGQLAVFVVYILYPKDFYSIPISIIVDRLYATSLLAALNMRPYIRQDHRAAFESTQPTDIGLSDTPRAGRTPASGGGGVGRVRIMHMQDTHLESGAHHSKSGFESETLGPSFDLGKAQRLV